MKRLYTVSVVFLPVLSIFISSAAYLCIPKIGLWRGGSIIGWIGLGIVFYNLENGSCLFRYASNDAGSKSYANAKSFSIIGRHPILCYFHFTKLQVASIWFDIDGCGSANQICSRIMALDAILELPLQDFDCKTN